MRKHGHYCKVCGEYKANEKFSGKGHAAHIYKACAALPPEVRELAQEQLEMRFPSRQEPEDLEDDSEFLLDEDDITE